MGSLFLLEVVKLRGCFERRLFWVVFVVCCGVLTAGVFFVGFCLEGFVFCCGFVVASTAVSFRSWCFVVFRYIVRHDL